MPGADRAHSSRENSIREDLGELSTAKFERHDLTLLYRHRDCVANGPVLGNTGVTTTQCAARQRADDSTQSSRGGSAVATTDLVTQNATSDAADDRSGGAVVLALNQNLLALLLRNRHHSWRDLQDVCNFLRLRWVLDLALNLGLRLFDQSSRQHGEADQSGTACRQDFHRSNSNARAAVFYGVIQRRMRARIQWRPSSQTAGRPGMMIIASAMAEKFCLTHGWSPNHHPNVVNPPTQSAAPSML